MRVRADRWTIAQVFLTVAALIFAIIIPLQIEGSQRRLQNQGNCTSAILALRKEIATFYDLGDDDKGFVMQDDPQHPEDKARRADIRRNAQNARDTVYVLCRELGGDFLLVNPEDKPWVDSPSDAASLWTRKNVSDILRESSTLIADIAKIKPKPFWDWSQLFG